MLFDVVARIAWGALLVLLSGLAASACGDGHAYCNVEQLSTRVVCSEGRVNQYNARVCTRRCDFSEHDSPCDDPTATYACRTKACNPDPIDARFNAYIAFGSTLNAPPAYIQRLYCLEGRPHHTGDACEIDDDCRPSANPGVRLQCDAATSACVEVPRPSASPLYGESCGINATTATSSVTVGVRCDVCRVGRNDRVYPPCAGQACTMNCQYDEDCPVGSVCVVPPAGALAEWSVCAPVVDGVIAPPGCTTN